MKRFYALSIALAVAVTSCGPAEGPLGIHEGDSIQRSKNTRGEWIDSGIVGSVGDDWVKVGQKRYTAEDLAGVKVYCSHD